MTATTDLRPHQQEALRQLKTGSILWGGVGTGKSRTALAYYVQEQEKRMNCDGPQDLYVITTAKKRDSLDWEIEAGGFVVGSTQDSTWYGILVVDSWNNLHKYVDVKNAFFIFDEQRLVGAGEWVKSFLKIAKENDWILLTATPGDTWLDYIPVFVANGFYKNRTHFKAEHVVYDSYTKFPKVKQYLNVQKLAKCRNKILVRMPYEKETTRHELTVWANHDAKLYRQAEVELQNPFTGSPLASTGEKFHVLRQIVNSDPRRLERLTELLDRHPKIIIFYNFNYELAMLKSLSALVKVSEWNGHRHQEIPKADSWAYLVQYQAGAEGWNCVETDTIVFFSLTYSYKLWEQAHGRIDRINTPFFDLYYYTIRSHARIDTAVWEALSRKESFQERNY